MPAAIERVLRRALTKSPDSRYQSMTVFTADLLALAPAADAAAFGPAGPPRIALTGQPEVAPVTERRPAAVLVTLVSDYGSLVERMAPAEARALVAGVRDMAVDAVRRHGGVVNQAIGEEIVSLFGVPAAHDDDELRAVRAAIELHARVGEIGSGVGSRPGIQIQSGLHAGSVVAQRLSEGPRRYAIVGRSGDCRLQARDRWAGPATSSSARNASVSCRRSSIPLRVRPWSSTPARASVDALSRDRADRPRDPPRGVGAIGADAVRRSAFRPGPARTACRACPFRRGSGRRDRRRGGPWQEPADIRTSRERLEDTGDVTLLQGRCRAFGDVAPYGPFIEIVRTSLRIDAHRPADPAAVVANVCALDASLESFVPLYLHLLSLRGERYPLPRHLQGEHLQAALVDALAAFFTAAVAAHHGRRAVRGLALGRQCVTRRARADP